MSSDDQHSELRSPPKKGRYTIEPRDPLIVMPSGKPTGQTPGSTLKAEVHESKNSPAPLESQFTPSNYSAEHQPPTTVTDAGQGLYPKPRKTAVERSSFADDSYK